MTSSGHILALVGGVGGGKFARGLTAVLPPDDLTIVINTADDFVHLGLHVSPDIDSVLYALADMNDDTRGWGLAGDTWNFMAAMKKLGGEAWFNLGDRDLATHVLRTQALAKGETLSQVTADLAKRLRVEYAVVPMTDDPFRSHVLTDEGVIDFQDYFVKRQWQPAFRGVTFEGAADARLSAGFRHALDRAQAVVIAPSNSFVSVDPILALPGVVDALKRKTVVAVSPMVGGKAVKGPLGKMMTERGEEPSALGVARHYGDLVDGWVIDTQDRALAPAIESIGHRVIVLDTVMRTLDDKKRLAQDAVAFALKLSVASVT